MPFDWKEFHNLACWLKDQSATACNDEAIRRSALSRLYYGAFCYARNYARDWLKYIPKKDGEDHGGLRAHFKNGKRGGISEKLDRLRQWRNECDYNDEIDFDLGQALIQAVETAEKVFIGLPPPAPKK